ncbi:hypothetical protein SPRG_17081 [Saprolegnia parasitica CBS 223.65]|uniref:MalT-like TPR region domain-containing protein n=1 Tax=Saprolegnia parasitica (strain CBS 223.65) TaxID=695850 RepID=A0A067BRX8_SAPPC|nr:hypothetical protein SPRG_17081 [Saprolegnia parasitica CBS 223.65]KDO17427.1 hypothetical protein SPRG_17081 [Saprolegnia parasitica CBS 223.65]|eukprot:XP_012211864.1 hypothetical protein SPRG_17081 [Saprolegnia parasitica CBS 223.65]
MVTTHNMRAHWDFGNLDATEAVFKQLIEVSASPIETMLFETQLARVHGLRGHFEAAHALLDAIETELGKIIGATNDVAELQTRYFLERGRALRSAKQPDAACPLFKQAVDVAVASHMDELAIDAIHMMALVVSPSEGIAWTERGIALAQRSDDANAQNWDAPLANNLGWAYFDAREYAKALATFETALVARERIGAPEQILIAKWAIARVYRALERYDDAIGLLMSLSPQDGYTHEELGENLLAQHKPEIAKTHFAQAYEALQHDPSVDAPRVAHLLAHSKELIATQDTLVEEFRAV